MLKTTHKMKQRMQMRDESSKRRIGPRPKNSCMHFYTLLHRQLSMSVTSICTVP